MSFLRVENLTHMYGSGASNSRPAINNISFSVDKGDVLGIIGHTGSGKSTLVSHLNGLLKPTDGKIYIDGKDIWENPKEIKKIRSRIGLVFQYPEYQLFEETVERDIAFGPANLGLSEEEVRGAVLNIAELMHIRPELLNKSPFDLSGGEKRRVAIAGVLAMRPEVVIFDEPTAGLDPIGRETIFKAIYDYKSKYNATVIIVSHSMEDIASLTNKVLVLKKGEVAMCDSTDKVFENSDKLRELGLGVPMVTEIFEKLSKIYPDICKKPLTVEQAVAELKDILGRGGAVNA